MMKFLKSRSLLLRRSHSTLGDNLLVSALARECTLQSKIPAAIESLYPELFYNNPDIKIILMSSKKRGIRFKKVESKKSPHKRQILIDSWRISTFLTRAGFFPKVVKARFVEPSPLSFFDQLAQSAGFSRLTYPRPWYFPFLWEQQEMKSIGENAIIMQSSGRTTYTPNREWYPERFEEMAAFLSKTHKIIQVGTPEGPSLKGALDLRGKTNFRQLGALLGCARLFVGQNGGLMHFARAVDLPSVIVYGGYAEPSMTGYPEFENLVSTPECSPCYLKDNCPHDRICLKEITVKDVLRKTEKILDLAPWQRHWEN